MDEEGIARIQPLVKMLHPERHQRASFSWHILAQAVDQEIDTATETVRFPGLVLRVSLILGSTWLINVGVQIEATLAQKKDDSPAHFGVVPGILKYSRLLVFLPICLAQRWGPSFDPSCFWIPRAGSSSSNYSSLGLNHVWITYDSS